MRSTLVLGVIDLPENGEPQRQQARAGLATQGERATGDELVCGVRCGDGPLLASCRPSIVKRHHWSGREEVVDARLLTCTLILKCIVILKNLQDPVFVLANLAVEAEVCASSFSLRHTFVRSNSDMVVFSTHNAQACHNGVDRHSFPRLACTGSDNGRAVVGYEDQRNSPLLRCGAFAGCHRWRKPRRGGRTICEKKKCEMPSFSWKTVKCPFLLYHL
jgi:hypothetical protein